jgi:MFS family permease
LHEVRPMRFDWLTLATFGGAFLAGMMLALLNSLRAGLGQRLGSDDSWTRRLVTAFTIVMVLLMFVAGVALDRWGGTRTIYEVLVLGALLAVVGMGTLAVRNSYRAALAGAALLGAGAACLFPAATLLMPQALLEAAARVRYTVHAMNLGYVAVGVGMFLSPALITLLQRRLGFQRGLLVAALLPLLYGGFVALPEKEAILPLGEAYDGTYSLELGLACLLVLFYFPLEGSLGAWAEKYLGELGFKVSTIPWVLAGFWLCYLGSRLTTSLLLVRGYGPLLLFLTSAAIAVTYWNLAGAGPSSGAKGMLVMWCCFGPIFPTLLGLLLPHAHGSGTAFAIVFGVGAVSNALFQPVLCPAVSTSSAQETLRLPRLLALLLAAVALVVSLVMSN